MQALLDDGQDATLHAVVCPHHQYNSSTDA